jgi:hypothetical protein
LAGAALFLGNQARQNALAARQSAAAAEANAKQAQAEQRIATVRELAAAAVSNLSTDPERSLLLTLHAIDVTAAAHQPILVKRRMRSIERCKPPACARPCGGTPRGSGG